MTAVPCECMVVVQSDGSSRCRRCRGDWYGCDCPSEHSIRCAEGGTSSRRDSAVTSAVSGSDVEQDS